MSVIRIYIAYCSNISCGIALSTKVNEQIAEFGSLRLLKKALSANKWLFFSKKAIFCSECSRRLNLKNMESV